MAKKKKAKPASVSSSKTSSEKETLERREKRVDIIDKIEQTKQRRRSAHEELKQQRSDLVADTILPILLAVGAKVIDNEQSKGRAEPVMKSLWDEEDLDLFRRKLIKKVKELYLFIKNQTSWDFSSKASL